VSPDLDRMNASLPLVQLEDRVPRKARRWNETADAWFDAKRKRRKYEGKGGRDALHLVKRIGEQLGVPPSRVTEDDLWRIVPMFGPAPKSKRYGYAVLGSFLSWRGNWIVQSSGIRREFPNRTTFTPVATAESWERGMNRAVGIQRVVLALVWPRRPCEVVRALLADVHLERGTMDVRQKGGHGDVTDWDVPLSGTVQRELRWYLPLRAQWAERATADSGHLLVHWYGDRLVGVSTAFVRRRVSEVIERGFPPYSFRRGGLTTLRDRGADWDDIKAVALHKSIGTTEIYVKSLQQQRRLPAVTRLLDPQEA
jgi:integrase